MAAQYLIVGDGAAGTTAAYYIRRNDPSGRIVILCDDPQPAYYRAALTNFLIGELREEQLFAVPPNFYTEHNVERLLTRVQSVDATNSRLQLASGGAPMPYDRLLVAAGATPALPPWPGADLGGVMTMRTMQDARTVMDGLASRAIRNAVVVGAGPLGIEWVQGLRNRGVEVGYVIRGDAFMEGILDRTGSDLVWSRCRQAGVDLRLNDEIAEILGTPDGRVRGVRLKSGAEIPCQLVGVAIGIRGNIEFLKDSGVKTERGIPVDDHMRTNIPNVFAAGDIATVYDPLTGAYRGLGLWEPARHHGRVSGINMSGGEATYQMGVQYNATRLWDLDFGGVGRTLETPQDTTTIDFPRTGGKILYRKLVMRDGKLQGALMVGLRKEGVRAKALQFKRVIEAGFDISGVAGELLDPEFDLASWIESHDEEMAGAPGMTGVIAPAVPTNAELRGGSSILAMPATVRPAGTAGAKGRVTMQGTNYSFELRPVTKIGRAPDNDMVLPDEYISARHAEIRFETSAWMVTDVGSRNGTFINDSPIMATTPLREGDVIRMGYTNLVVSGTEAEPAPSAGFGHRDASTMEPSVSASKPEPLAAVLPAGTVLGYLQLNGQRFDLSGQTASLGRDPKSEVQINDPAVSFTHAQITRMGNDLYLRDVGSRNGTYVNMQLVTIPHPLREGDTIHVGQTDMTFHSSVGRSEDRRQEQEPAPAPAPTPAPPPVAPAPAPPPAMPGMPPAPVPEAPQPQPGMPPAQPGMPPAQPGMPPAPPGMPPAPSQPAPPPPPSAPAPPTGPIPGAPVGFQPAAGPPPAAPPTPAPWETAPPPAPSPAPPQIPPGGTQAPGVAAGQARLVVRGGPMVGLPFALTGESMRIGRDPSNEIVIRDQTVSRAHARVDRRGADWVIIDLGSLNGSHVNGQRLVANQEVQLPPGATVQLGDVILSFEVT